MTVSMKPERAEDEKRSSGGANGYFAAMRILRGLRLTTIVPPNQRARCGRANHVLRAMLDFADTTTWVAYPSAKRIAEETDLSEPTVTAALKDLVTWGLLVIDRPGGGRNLTTRYRINLLSFAPENTKGALGNCAAETPKPSGRNTQAQRENTKAQDPETPKPRGSKHQSPLGGTSQLEPPNSEPPNSEPPNSEPLSPARARKSGAGAPGEREAMSARDRYHREVFWQSYPEDARKRRGTFEQAWASAMKSVDTETMVVALGKQLAVGHLVNDNGYTILPSTWLTSGCWADELAYDASREEAQHALNFEAEHIERLWNEAQAEHAEQQGAKA